MWRGATQRARGALLARSTATWSALVRPPRCALCTLRVSSPRTHDHDVHASIWVRPHEDEPRAAASTILQLEEGTFGLGNHSWFFAAPEDDGAGMQLSSVKKKRRMKMNKHKRRKRSKLNRLKKRAN
jgi:hypothetical protein